MLNFLAGELLFCRLLAIRFPTIVSYNLIILRLNVFVLYIVESPNDYISQISREVNSKLTTKAQLCQDPFKVFKYWFSNIFKSNIPYFADFMILLTLVIKLCSPKLL